MTQNCDASLSGQMLLIHSAFAITLPATLWMRPVQSLYNLAHPGSGHIFQVTAVRLEAEQIQMVGKAR